MSKDVRELRLMLRRMFAVCAISGGLSVSATEYFVSKERPDDSGDGLTTETAKRTIQAAMDLTKEGDIVTVLPGVYDEGAGSADNEAARVVITNKCIWLRSSEGKDRTFIVGKHDNTDTGLGENALRCIYMNNLSTIVEGFTICNGATAEAGRGGAVYSKQSCYYNYVCDSVLSNNVAKYGAALVGGTLLRCLVAGNTATGNSTAIYDGYAYSSVFVGNDDIAEPFRYCRAIVGCTIHGNKSSASYNGRNISWLNCLVVDHDGNIGISNHSDYNSYATNSVFSCAESDFKGSENCLFDVADHQLVAPPFGDYRLLANSSAIGRGDAIHTAKISIYSLKADWDKYIEDTYYWRDYYGKPIPKTGTINCGAVQETVDPESGCVVFFGDQGVQWTTSAGKVPLRDRRAYAYAATYPTQWCAKATFASGKPLFKYEINPAYTMQLCHYPEFDGTFRFAPPPKGVVVTNHAYASHDVYYVNASSSAENPDGLTPETAFATIQDAVDAASSTYSTRSYISVAPGVYDKGGAFHKSLSNRVAVAGKTLRIVSTHGAERTFIVGAPDPDTGGYGPNAVRCVSWYHGGRIGGLQGFTLTGGYTGVTPEGVNQFTDSAAAGAYNGSMEHVLDCIITNNHAHWASASKNGYFFRCLIADNTTVHQGTVWGANLMSCQVRDNKVGDDSNPSVLWNSVIARFCTIDGAIGSKTHLYASILRGEHHVTSDCLLDNSIICGANLAEGVTVTNCIFADPCLSGADDWRILSCSPAIAHADLADLREHLSYTSGDYNGRPLRFSPDGLMTAGAYQWPVQAVSVAVSRGGPQPLTVTGGAVGTNALESAASITVEAQKKSDAGRRFLGFTVNGVDYPADQLTCTVTQTGEPSGCISILANYSSVPMAVILR